MIGSHSDVGVISGGGSAQVDPPGGSAVLAPPGSAAEGTVEALLTVHVWYPSSPLNAIRAKAPRAKVEYNAGADPASAAALAKASDVAIVLVNQPASEATDYSLTLPGDQDKLVAAVAAANPHTPSKPGFRAYAAEKPSPTFCSATRTPPAGCPSPSPRARRTCRIPNSSCRPAPGPDRSTALTGNARRSTPTTPKRSR